ncbi:MAG: serine/threonine-protein kinase, partial [Myxococcales bacterium]|nr:serine/threonine-protein kinase [Myxococcales bacterium]
MGVVFRALDVPANQPVAIKLLRPEYRNAEAAERFVREVKHTAKLVHPNVVRVLDVGKTTEGELYFVMELLEGDSLSAVLRREGQLSVERTVQMAVQVCAALDAAHRAGLVHRDIKPANLVLVPRGQAPELVKVLDFGIARSLDGETQLTGTGLIVGTTEYLAPVQILGQHYDGRAVM